MLDYPQNKDLLDMLLRLMHERDFSKITEIRRALNLLRDELDHPGAMKEELQALRFYLGDDSLELTEARRKLAEDLRHQALPKEAEAVKLQDLLLKTIVPYLRYTHPRYIAHRQREKKSAESSI